MNWKEVEERLVEAAELWMRSPGSGFGPNPAGGWATDGPWSRMTRADRAGSSMDGWRQALADQAVEAARDKGAFASSDAVALGLMSEDVARRDEASGWLVLVAEADRQLLLAAVVQQARTGRRIDWTGVQHRVGGRGRDGLRRRYRRVLEALAVAVAASKLKAVA